MPTVLRGRPGRRAGGGRGDKSRIFRLRRLRRLWRHLWLSILLGPTAKAQGCTRKARLPEFLHQLLCMPPHEFKRFWSFNAKHHPDRLAMMLDVKSHRPQLFGVQKHLYCAGFSPLSGRHVLRGQSLNENRREEHRLGNIALLCTVQRPRHNRA